MKTYKIGFSFRSWLMLLGAWASFTVAFPALGQIEVIPQERLNGVLLALPYRYYDFEELPVHGSSCALDLDTAISNPLIYNRFSITDPFCLRSGACSPPTCWIEGPDDKNIVLILNPGARVDFPFNPKVAVFAVQGVGDNPFTFGVIDAQGANAIIPSQGSTTERIFLGIQATNGISSVHVLDVGGTGGPLVLTGLITESPPLPPLNLTAETSFDNVSLFWESRFDVFTIFIIERKTGEGEWEELVSFSRDVHSMVDTSAAQGTTYTYRVKTRNDAGDSPYSNEATATTLTMRTNTLVALARHDGYVIERAEHMNVGGVAVASSSGLAALRAGDTDADQQCKAFVSFDTRSIPIDGQIVMARLKLKRGRVIGTDPFLTHGFCFVDIKGGQGFSGSPGVQATDFHAPTGIRRRSMQLGNIEGGFSEGGVPEALLSAINRMGVTQFRIYFGRDDNDDRSADLAGWCSAEHPDPANRPMLEITYWQ